MLQKKEEPQYTRTTTTVAVTVNCYDNKNQVFDIRGINYSLRNPSKTIYLTHRIYYQQHIQSDNNNYQLYELLEGLAILSIRSKSYQQHKVRTSIKYFEIYFET